MDQTAMPVATPAPGYPVRPMLNPAAASMSRLWGIPILGFVLRSLLAIPLYLALVIVGIAAYVAILLNWIPVLLTGRQAGWVYAILGTYLDWAWRTAAYMTFLVGGYPLSGSFGARVEIDRQQHFNQLWGIPLLGVMVRGLLVIPHVIVLSFIGIVASLFVLVSWVPILINGRQAELITQVVGGFYRWYLRVTAYVLLVASPYPPFAFD